jgi:hypothetical protein
MEGSTDNFYHELPCLGSLEEAVDPANLHPLPADWAFLATDVVNSTALIDSGQYRNINLTAAACITSVTNALDRMDFPFVFAGDGAHIACPQSRAGEALIALQAVARRVQRMFGIQLRVGGFRMDALQDVGMEIRVGKTPLAPDLFQAVFWGTGVSGIEHELRMNARSLELPAGLPEPDLTGLECRWKQVPSSKDEVMNVLVEAAPGHPDPTALYRWVLEWVHSCVGSREERHPIRKDLLSLQLNPGGARLEVDIREGNKPWWKKAVRRQWNALENTVGTYLMQNKKTFKGVDWGKYLEDVTRFNDSEKFNGMLAMLVVCHRAEGKLLEEALEEKFQAGELVYGLHSSKTSIITCMVFDNYKRHVHFVDGADGGYAMAARALKQRIKTLAGDA